MDPSSRKMHNLISRGPTQAQPSQLGPLCNKLPAQLFSEVLPPCMVSKYNSTESVTISKQEDRKWSMIRLLFWLEPQKESTIPAPQEETILKWFTFLSIIKLWGFRAERYIKSYLCSYRNPALQESFTQCLPPTLVSETSVSKEAIHSPSRYS